MSTRCRLVVLGNDLPETVLPTLPPDVSWDLVTTWPDMTATVARAEGPVRLLISATRLDTDGRQRLTGFRRQRPHVLVAVYLASERFEDFDRALALTRLRVDFVHPPRLSEKILSLLIGERLNVARHVEASLNVSNPVALDFLRLLDREPAYWERPVEDVASRLGVGRSTLFRELASAGLPTPQACQFLFRVAAACRVAMLGGTLRAITRAAGYTEVSSLRRALRRKLGLSLTAIRRKDMWRESWAVLASRVTNRGQIRPH